MTIAEVYLYGKLIGAVSLQDNEQYAEFAYTEEFANSGIELSPLMMPLREGAIYRFVTLNPESFYGLPGMLADSLPDSFGQSIVDEWLARQGRTRASFNAVERLCYTGQRGMGALEYKPATGLDLETSKTVQIDSLVKLASDIMARRNDVSIRYDSDAINDQALSQIMTIGTSAGGARAKAIIAWNKETHEIKSGQINAGKGFEYYLIKFDGVKENRDKEEADGEGYTNIEYAYYLMAIAAGVKMSECSLLPDRRLNHFMTKRFDRTKDGGKIHMQTLAGLAHYDFKQAGANSYEQVFGIIRKLNLGKDTTEQFYTRLVFNVLGMNMDDHVKNISFLMDRDGKWALSPAYDIAFAYNKDGDWTSKHQMKVNGKQDDIDMDDLLACAKTVEIKEKRAIAIINQVILQVKNWENYAKKAQVPQDRKEYISKLLQQNLEKFQGLE